MRHAEGDEFEGFVAARWPALEAVALAVTLDPAVAREVTTATLTALHGRWSAVVEDGAPTAAARSGLLARLDDRGPRDIATSGPPVPPELLDAARDPSAPADPVPGALLTALAAEPAWVRARLAAVTLWELVDDEVAALAPAGGRASRGGRDGGRDGVLGALDDARGRLLAAHRAALASTGSAPADHRAPGDLADLLDRLAASLPGPPAADELVRARQRGVRRRSLVVVGALAVTGVGAGTWAMASGSPTPTAASPRARPAPSTAGPDDPAWASADRWPPRGALGRDPEVQAMLARVTPGARLLFADDVEGRRLVISTDPQVPSESGLVLRAWGGPAGTSPRRLTDVQIGYGWAGDTRDALALAVTAGRGSVLVALSRPSVREGRYSLVVRPTKDGQVRREWTRFTLRDGVATTVLGRDAGPAARIQLGDLDGPLARELTPTDMGVGPGGFTESTVQEIARALGVARRSLTVERTSHVLPDDSFRDVLGVKGTSVADTVVVRTAEGAVIRFASFRGGSNGESAEYGDPPLVVPAAAVRAPYVAALIGTQERARYFVTVPQGSATVQLRTVTGVALSRPTRVRGRAAVAQLVTGTNDEDVRVVARGADGRLLYDDVPPKGRDVFDLYDFFGTGSGTYYS
ncbi:hypothetical protein [Arthrobacter sp. NEB 688]|uniref:hypothetical protein n=1 Tax=Arthrobacter sp. NEB 688 TaxID=904039 RepID=UPI001566AFD8|nr:hypothetical protein [Arthrobacter sp. NEB 688]QKE82707.1 hypothetical protein HL663_01215 [Arthrobacter sp. NEB 688]